MSPRVASRLAWSLWALAALMVAGSAALIALAWGIPTPAEDLGPDGVGFLVAFLAFPTVGAVVASRRPDNRIGWLFCGVGILLGLAAFVPEFADYALFAKPGSLPGGRWAAWASGWLDSTFILSVCLILLLFPTGRLISRRWRPALWLAAASLSTAILNSLVRPGMIRADLPVENPLGIEGAKTFLDVVDVVAWVVFVVSVVVSALSMVLRFRRARGDERQQVKWIAYAAGLLVASFLAANGAGALGSFWDKVADALIGVAFAAIPVSAGIAILRYRLYDIDRVINRTLVYGVLTAGLASFYFGIVIGLQAASSSVTRGSDLAVAGSTLAVAALFRPARRRVQRLVDRRFYRRKVDAERTLGAFTDRLRRQIDLDSLTGELETVVRETLQPAHVSLWVRAQEAEA